MSRGIYDNAYNRNRTRIDTRPQSDPAVAAGMRRIHRDMDGSVIGGYTAEGQPVGTMKSPNRRIDKSFSVPTSRFRDNAPAAGAGVPAPMAGPTAPASPVSVTPLLDAGPQTPRLDAMAKPAPTNLEKRQSLFRDMQKVGAGGITPVMKQQAAALGVKRSGWRSAMGKLQAAPAAIAAPGAPPAAAGGVPASLARPAGMPAATPPPLAGKEKAVADMAKYGTTGAAERFLAANPAKDAQARITTRNTQQAAVKAELDAVDQRTASQGLGQPAFGKRAGTGSSRFRSAMR